MKGTQDFIIFLFKISIARPVYKMTEITGRILEGHSQCFLQALYGYQYVHTHIPHTHTHTHTHTHSHKVVKDRFSALLD